MLARNNPSKDITDAFKMLLNNHMILDLTTFNNDGQTVIDIAQEKGNDELVALLQANIMDEVKWDPKFCFLQLFIHY